MAETAAPKTCSRCGTEYPNDLDHFRPQYHPGEPPRPSGVCRQCHNKEKNARYHGRKPERPTAPPVAPKVVSVIPTVSTIPVVSTVSVVSPGPAVAMSIRLPRPVHEQLRTYAFNHRLSMNRAVVKLITEGMGASRPEREDITPKR